MQFIVDNYIWFLVGGIIILMAVIGYFADKANFGRKKSTDEDTLKPKKEKQKKVKEEKPTKIEVDAKGIGELSQSVIDNSLNEQSSTDSIKETNENIDQALFAPLESSSQESNQQNSVKTDIEEVIDNHEDESKAVQDLTPIEPTNLEISNDSNNPSTDEDDIWKF